MAKQNKVALVTGGSRGIGLGIAKCLAAEGCDIAINGVRDESAASETLETLRGMGVAVVYCQGDVSQPEHRQNIIQTVRDRLGQLNFLINNAGITSPGRKDILEAEEDSFDRVMDVNLKGPYFLTQAAANWMVEQRREDPGFDACVINVSSVSAEVVSTNRGDYCLTKAAIAMATKLWAVRLAEFDIPVYEIQPGIIATDMTAGVTAKYDKLIAEGLTLQRRWGQPEDVGKAVAMLVRGDLPYSTGQVLQMDGGMRIPSL
jgi:3-oxoacyl-[acyl-carrier protein] reductase